MLRRINKILIICVVIVLALSTSAFAISKGALEHKNGYSSNGKTIWPGENPDDNFDGDTRDYCIQANDLTIGISEMKTDQWKANLTNEELKYATNTLRYGGNKANGSVDISRVVPKEGVYTCWYIVPMLTGDTALFDRDTRKSFKVTVVKDEATVSFKDNILASINKRILDERTYSPIDAVINISEIGTVNKAGYKFKGWYRDAQLSEPFLIPGDDSYQEQPVTSDIVLYPKWEKKTVPAPKKPSNPGASLKHTGVEANKIGKEGPIFFAKTSNNSISEIVEPEAMQNKENSAEVAVKSTNNSGGNGISVVEIMILVACLVGALGLSVSVAMDARVLMWYFKKKAEREMA